MRKDQSRTKIIPMAKVRPGQPFKHYGQSYRRAEEDEVHKHPGRDHPRFGKDIVLAYLLANQAVPVTFVEYERVMVR